MFGKGIVRNLSGGICAAFLSLCTLSASFAADADPKPRVWIFNGTPGDDEHHGAPQPRLPAPQRRDEFELIRIR